MPNYDFLNLSPDEFEELTRDLLQKKLKVFIQSFKSGRDKGVDLRFAYDDSKSSIVQCKRYKDYTSLKSKLEIESNKVKKLKPKQYILVTSAPLSDPNKQEIKKLFAPYIKSNRRYTR
jgi:hypothetical protein